MPKPNATSSEASEADEQFRRSNAACMRTLAQDAGLEVELQHATAALALGVLVPSNNLNTRVSQQASIRGIGDAIALVGAYHDHVLHQQSLPENHHEQALFNALERTRCEALGTNGYRGVAKNLAWLESQTHSAQSIKRSSGIEQLSLVLAALAKEALVSEPLSLNSTSPSLLSLVNHWRATIEPKIESLLKPMAMAQADQSAYAQLALSMIKQLDVQSMVAKGDVDETNEAQRLEPAPDNDEEPNSADETDAQDNEAMLEEAAADAMREELEEQEDSIQSAADDADESGSTQQNKDAPVSSDAESVGRAESLGGKGYSVFSKQFDEIVTPTDLSDDTELEELRTKLDEQIERHSSLVGRLSGRLQRLLMAEQQRHWIFDLDEGHLDTSRLTRLVTQPMSSLTFKAESELKFKDTTITLLLDNSKSMLGKPITIAASCADLLAQTLERCGVSVEILGFTTTELHGGSVADAWKQAGAVDNPGRLNGLRHIIYKSAETPYRSSRKGLGLMLRGDILKQNIDGEALLWAHSRIKRRSEQRKIIMMISDGAPIDTSTMSNNPENYLIDHLHGVIGELQQRGGVELVAIGIGHDVSVYYDKSITIYDVKKLGRAMLAQLSELFRDRSSGAS